MAKPSSVSMLQKEIQTTSRIDEVRRIISAARQQGETIACVPTMGALHEGHLSLIRTAREECDFVVVTLFVNPTQFGPNEDYKEYPRTFDRDLAACREAGADLVFHPDTETVYPADFKTFIEVEGLSDVWEGAFRPGHFRGVATVVLKLLNILKPDFAYFGRKDYQQQTLIRRMCSDLNVASEIRICPTVREPDGLALSSRNVYLSPQERHSALSLSQSLILARRRLMAGEKDVAAIREAMLAHLNGATGVVVDYVTIVDPETLEEIEQPLPEMIALVAARVGDTRLIDNLPIQLIK